MFFGLFIKLLRININKNKIFLILLTYTITHNLKGIKHDNLKRNNPRICYFLFLYFYTLQNIFLNLFMIKDSNFSKT